MSARDVYELSCAALGGRSGTVAVLKVYMDESGVHDGSPVVTVAAYVARPKTWREWTKRWNVAKRPIKVYHATDAQNLQGEFKGWSKEDRDVLVKRVLPVIAEEPLLPGIVIGIHLHEFEKALSNNRELSWLIGNPYSACFQWLIQTIMMLQHSRFSSERIAFIHEVNSYKGEALSSFDFINEYSNPQKSKLSITFGSKEEYEPLQAADILAYEGNKRLRDPDKPERKPWAVLNHDKRIIARHYGKRNMGELVTRLHKIKDGSIGELMRSDAVGQFLTRPLYSLLKA